MFPQEHTKPSPCAMNLFSNFWTSVSPQDCDYTRISSRSALACSCSLALDFSLTHLQ